MKQFYLIRTNKELEKLTGLTNDELWKAGVCLDDYDYFLTIKTKKEPDDFKREFVPKDELWTKLLLGCCYNAWFHIKGKNDNFYIGGAYHA